MYKQFFIFILLLFFTISCSFFEVNSKKEPLLEVDTMVDFNSVDAFPLFPKCKEIPSREKQQICFQLEMSKHIYASLKNYNLNAKELVNDTVLVKLKVNSDGIISLSDIQISERTKVLLPEFDSIVKAGLNELPMVQPAIKRNMPVTTEFTLPIVLKN